MYLFMLILSPLATLVAASLIYIFINVLRGIPPLVALNSFKALIYSFMPYFPYLTSIPAILVLVLLISKKWKKTFVSYSLENRLAA